MNVDEGGEWRLREFVVRWEEKKRMVVDVRERSSERRI